MGLGGLKWVIDGSYVGLGWVEAVLVESGCVMTHKQEIQEQESKVGPIAIRTVVMEKTYLDGCHVLGISAERIIGSRWFDFHFLQWPANSSSSSSKHGSNYIGISYTNSCKPYVKSIIW